YLFWKIDGAVEVRRRWAPSISEAERDCVTFIGRRDAPPAHVLLRLEQHPADAIVLESHGCEISLQAIGIRKRHAALERATQVERDVGSLIGGAATEAAGFIGDTGINRLATEVDRLHDVVALLAQTVIDTDPHAGDVDIDARRLVFIDNGDNPSHGLHGV